MAVLKAREKVQKSVLSNPSTSGHGPDVLRQVNDFSQRIWKLANDPTKGVAF